MMLYSRRSAKSVACSRLNVIGVSVFFFLPALVATLTSFDEFHSVTTTGWPAALSHFARSPSCVVFPDPSIPSTTNSFPRYSCGVVSRFSIRVPFLCRGAAPCAVGQLKSYRFSEDPFQWLGMALRRPHFQLGIASSTQ